MTRYYSPAKVNLFLHVKERRPDGYHELSSLFQTIDLFDTLDITCCENHDRLAVNDPSIPCDTTNLILKATALFRQKTKSSQYFNIILNKNIPMEAGLGGGSSNAATTLWAINVLCGSPATIEELMTWGAEIGSDVAFFLSEGTALCTGRGEKIHPVPALTPQRSGWIVKPSFGLSTPSVYKHLKLAKLPQNEPEKALKKIIEGELCYFNDLESPAFSLSPPLAALKEELITLGYEKVMMTGSGSAIVCIGLQQPPEREGLWAQKICFVNRNADTWYS